MLTSSLDTRPYSAWASGYTVARPAVLFSLITAIITLCLGLVLSQGVNTVWWRKALNGTWSQKLSRECGIICSVIALPMSCYTNR